MASQCLALIRMPCNVIVHIYEFSRWQFGFQLFFFSFFFFSFVHLFNICQLGPRISSWPCRKICNTFERNRFFSGTFLSIFSPAPFSTHANFAIHSHPICIILILSIASFCTTFGAPAHTHSRASRSARVKPVIDCERFFLDFPIFRILNLHYSVSLLIVFFSNFSCFGKYFCAFSVAIAENNLLFLCPN